MNDHGYEFFADCRVLAGEFGTGGSYGVVHTS
jgi:hypothetical protein